MFAYFYQVCAVIFLLQGVSIPFLVLFSGVIWRRQSSKLESLKKEWGVARGNRVSSDEIFELILKAPAELRPLDCITCGAGLVLHKTETFCPQCHARGDLPQDYAEAGELKLQVRRLLKSATRHWRVAT